MNWQRIKETLLNFRDYLINLRSSNFNKPHVIRWKLNRKRRLINKYFNGSFPE
jgi:hypothetical protein